MDAIAESAFPLLQIATARFQFPQRELKFEKLGLLIREMDASIQSTLYRYKSRNPCHGKDSKECRKSTKRTVLISSDGAGGEDPAV
jgi:hypothetical protein